VNKETSAVLRQERLRLKALRESNRHQEAERIKAVRQSNANNQAKWQREQQTRELTLERQKERMETLQAEIARIQKSIDANLQSIVRARKPPMSSGASIRRSMMINASLLEKRDRLQAEYDRLEAAVGKSGQ